MCFYVGNATIRESPCVGLALCAYMYIQINLGAMLLLYGITEISSVVVRMCVPTWLGNMQLHTCICSAMVHHCYCIWHHTMEKFQCGGLFGGSWIVDVLSCAVHCLGGLHDVSWVVHCLGAICFNGQCIAWMGCMLRAGWCIVWVGCMMRIG
jgi:hypothetical protein